MEVASLVLAVAAIALSVSIEWMKRPRIEIRAVIWQSKTPVTWTFAAVKIHNRPLPTLLQAVIVRGAAECCEVTLEFREPGKGQLALPRVAARWRSHPEPVRSVLLIDANGKPSNVREYDPTIMPQTKRLDIPAGVDGEEIEVAILRNDGSASAWGAESFAFPNWANPDWDLKRQVYEINVCVRASGIIQNRRFRLDNLAPDFAKFPSLEAVQQDIRLTVGEILQPLLLTVVELLYGDTILLEQRAAGVVDYNIQALQALTPSNRKRFTAETPTVRVWQQALWNDLDLKRSGVVRWVNEDDPVPIVSEGYEFTELLLIDGITKTEVDVIGQHEPPLGVL